MNYQMEIKQNNLRKHLDRRNEMRKDSAKNSQGDPYINNGGTQEWNKNFCRIQDKLMENRQKESYATRDALENDIRFNQSIMNQRQREK